MTNASNRANAQAMPIDRRAALGSLAAAGALLAVPKLAKASAEPDVEIVALADEIVRRTQEGDRFLEARVDPLHERFVDILRDNSMPWSVVSEKARTFSKETGHEAAVVAHSDFVDATDKLFKRLMAIPATTQLGRAAKVRALIAHVMRSDWRGPSRELDWDIEMARALLGEFAGLSAAELEAI